MVRRNKQTQTYLDPALSFVECSVRVSHTLARLIRKCATLEAGGTSAHDSLLVSAGIQAGEIETLRAQAKQSEGELKQAREREAQLQCALDQAKTTIALRDKELKDIRQVLNKTAEAEKRSRQAIEAFDRKVIELQLAIAACREKLTCTISTDGLGEHALAVLSIFKDRLAHGEGIAEAARWVPLAIARSMWTPRSQNRTVLRCAHSRPCSRVPLGASGSCCGYSERPTRDDGQRRSYAGIADRLPIGGGNDERGHRVNHRWKPCVCSPRRGSR